MAGLKVITKPAVEPVTLDEVLTQLRYDEPDEQVTEQINDLITAAREWCEGYQNRAYITQTLELALDWWPACDYADLPRPDLQSLISLTYAGEVVDSASYVVDDYAFVARVVRARGTNVNWPSGNLPAVNGILIRYVAGYKPAPGAVVEGENLGTGDDTEQTYTVEHYPMIKNSETVYFDGTPSATYTINYETGQIVCTPGNGVVVTIDYTQETDYAANVPSRIKQAIILLTTHWYENGKCDPPPAVYSLLNLDRVVPI